MKHKETIVKIVLMLLIYLASIAILINLVNADYYNNINIDGTTLHDTNELAEYVANWPWAFTQKPADELQGETISTGGLLNKKSIVCLYHKQGISEKQSKHTILNVLDLYFQDGNYYYYNSSNKQTRMLDQDSAFFWGAIINQYSSGNTQGQGGKKLAINIALKCANFGEKIGLDPRFYNNHKWQDEILVDPNSGETAARSKGNMLLASNLKKDESVQPKVANVISSGDATATYLGPFKLNYGSDSGEYIKVEVKTPNKTIDYGIGYCDSTTASYGYDKMPKDQMFYLRVPDKLEGNIEVKFKLSTNKVYRARFLALARLDESSQQLGIFASMDYDAEISTTYYIDNLSCIKVIKKGENGKRQENVGFFISKIEGNEKKPLWGGEAYMTGNMTFNSGWWGFCDNKNYYGATSFFTDSNGEFSIYGLPAGIYEVGEVYNESGGVGEYNVSYISNYEIQSNKSNTISGTFNEVLKEDDNIDRHNYKNFMPKIQSIKGIDLSSEGTKVTVDITDKVEDKCTLKIIKKDESGNLQKNVGFIIYRENSWNSVPYGYLIYDGNDFSYVDEDGNIANNGRKALTGVQTYYNGSHSGGAHLWGFWDGEGDQNAAREIATIFYTDKNGQFEIKNLPAGRYYIGEVYNANEGYESSLLNRYTVIVKDIAGQEKSNDTYNSDKTTRSVDNLDWYKDKMPYTQTITHYLKRTTENIITIEDTTEVSLTIHKKNTSNLSNESTYTDAENVKFKIKSISGKNDGKFVTKNNDKIGFGNEAYEFITEQDGKFNVSLPEGDYQIIEVSNPNCNKNIRKTDIITKPNNSNVKIETENQNRDRVKIVNLTKGAYEILLVDYEGTSSGSNSYYISGTVFVDNSAGKNNQLGIYGNEDIVIKDARVQIVNKNNENSIAGSGNTGEDGTYKIKVNDNIDISNYYVKVDFKNAKIKNDIQGWSSLEYKSYVRTSSVFNSREGSKAVEYIEGIGKTYFGNDEEIEREKGLTYLKDNYYDNKTIYGANMGIRKLSETEYMDQTISKVEIEANGKRYTYYYGENGNVPEAKDAPTVNWQGTDIEKTFSRNIYPSDISAFEAGRIGMSVKITYKITIRNLANDNTWGFDWDIREEELTYTKENSKGEYFRSEATGHFCREDSMNVISVTDEFDTTIYKLADNDNWKISGNGNIAVYTGNIKPMEKAGKDDTRTIYITFEVKDEKIKEILNTKGIKENSRTTANAKVTHNWSNHINYRTQSRRWISASGSKKDGTYVEAHWGEWSSWNNQTEDGNTADKTGDKGKRTFDSSAGPAEAPYCIFKLPNNKERTISGNVYEDINVKESTHELIGNGEYDNEKGIENVTVELHNMDGSLATLYSIYDSDTRNIIETGNDGSYTFTGVVAGDYYIVYKYGNGDQYIEGKKVYSSQYKSTIVQSKKYNYIEDDSGGNWYIGSGDTSKAVDKISDREDNNNTYNYSSLYSGVNSNENNHSNKLIEARTPTFSTGIEFTKVESSYYNKNEEFGTVPSYNEMNFGIIKMPVVSVNIYNTISYVTMTLSNGQVITQGDPSGTTNIQYVSTLDENDTPYGYGRGGYVKVEIDTNYLYGSTLEVTYDLKVLNNSDLNYKTEKYYYYGEHGKTSDEYTVSIDRILYYIDPAMTYMYSTKENIEIEGYSETSDKKLESMSPVNNASKVNAGREITKEPKEMLDINLKTNKEIHTYYSKDEKTSKVINVLSVTTSKLLSTEDDDLEFKNYAEVVKITTDKDGNGNICRFMAPTASFESAAINVLGSSEDKLSDIIKNSRNSLYRRDYRSITTDVATITVTPPTGLKENLIIFISIGIGLIVFVGGVIIIKKKVL